jgi:cyclopropane fatty-acyl-phospholipid synthase-like methyltransferase
MRNVLDEKPTVDLNGRLRFSVGFVDQTDLFGKKVLDIGCGFGWFELNALSRGVREIVGTEISEVDLQPINRHLHDPKLVTEVASAIDIPFPDRSFDAVVSWEVIEHIPPHTEPIMFSEVARVLKPGGQFYLSTPNASPLSTAADPAWWLIKHRHYAPDKLRQLAQEAGLRVARLEVKGGLWEIAFTWNLYLSKWILRRRPIAERAFHRQVNREYGTPGFNDLFMKMTKPVSP